MIKLNRTKTSTQVNNSPPGSLSKYSVKDADLSKAFKDGKLSSSSINQLSDVELGNILKTIDNFDVIDINSLNAINNKTFELAKSRSTNIKNAFENLSPSKKNNIQNELSIDNLEINATRNDIGVSYDGEIEIDSINNKLNTYLDSKSNADRVDIMAKNQTRMEEIQLLLNKKTLTDIESTRLNNEFKVLSTENLLIDLKQTPGISTRIQKGVANTSSYLFNKLFTYKKVVVLGIIGSLVVAELAINAHIDALKNAKNETLDQTVEFLEKSIEFCGKYSEQINKQINAYGDSDLAKQTELTTLYLRWLSTDGNLETKNTKYFLEPKDITRLKELVPEIKNDDIPKSFDICLNTQFTKQVDDQKKKNEEEAEKDKNPITKGFETVSDLISDGFKNVGDLFNISPIVLVGIILLLIFLILF